MDCCSKGTKWPWQQQGEEKEDLTFQSDCNIQLLAHQQIRISLSTKMSAKFKYFVFHLWDLYAAAKAKISSYSVF